MMRQVSIPLGNEHFPFPGEVEAMAKQMADRIDTHSIAWMTDQIRLDMAYGISDELRWPHSGIVQYGKPMTIRWMPDRDFAFLIKGREVDVVSRAEVQELACSGSPWRDLCREALK